MNVRVLSFLLCYLNQQFLITFISHRSYQATKSPKLFVELIFKIILWQILEKLLDRPAVMIVV